MTFLASHEGVTPLIQAGLGAASVSPPEAVRAELRAGYLATFRFNQSRVWPTLVRALGVLAAAGLEPIVLKGAALAHLAYPQSTYRTLSDVDLLLPAEHLARAGDALLRAGFRPASGALHPSNHHHGQPLFPPGDGVAVELHHDLVPAENPYALDVQVLQAKAQRVQIAGQATRVLAPADCLLHICLHLTYGHRYQFYPLRSLVDVLAITTRQACTIDWDGLVHTARSSRTRGAVYWPLRFAERWLGAPIPGEVLAALAPPSLTRRLIQTIAEPRYILTGRRPARRGSDVLYDLLLDHSLYNGCPVDEQARAMLARLFPSREAIAHLPPAVTHSRSRYLAYLASPGRASRGLLAVGRLLRSIRSG